MSVKTALLTGGNRGIGLSIALELQAAGFQICLGMRQPNKRPAGLNGALALPYEASVAGSADSLVAEMVARLGRIDVVVASAGILRNVSIRDGKDSDLDDLLDINVKAPYRLARACLPHLEASGQGRFIMLSSLSGKRVRGLNVGYQMSKHAVMALAHSVRRAGWDKGVRATAICPAYVNTEMVAGVAGLDTQMLTQPADLAKLVATIVQLPNTACVAEILVNFQHEDMV